MNLGIEPADQVVRYSLEGAEMALKLSGLAAKNFAVFAYAVLKDQKKTRGKTRLVRMLKEQRPLKFFTVPQERMREFAREAKSRGLLFVPIRSKQNPTDIEIAVFADDAAKVSRVLDQLRLDFVPAGEAVAAETREPPVPTETVQTQDGAVEFQVGGFEADFNMAGGAEGNFPPGRGEGRNPSGSFSPGSGNSPGSDSRKPKPSVREGLKEIQAELGQKGEIPSPVPVKTKERQVGR